MTISLIVAMSRNRVIGKDNKLPWHMPADLKRFQELTTGKPIIMGRKTFEAIGHALPNRVNIVMTSDASFTAKGCVAVHSVDEALAAAGGADEVMVIGGQKIFEQFLPMANRIYLTIIDADIEGDTFFPGYDSSAWKKVAREEYRADEKNPYAYMFLTFNRGA